MSGHETLASSLASRWWHTTRMMHLPPFPNNADAIATQPGEPGCPDRSSRKGGNIVHRWWLCNHDNQSARLARGATHNPKVSSPMVPYQDEPNAASLIGAHESGIIFLTSLSKSGSRIGVGIRARPHCRLSSRCCGAKSWRLARTALVVLELMTESGMGSGHSAVTDTP